MRRRANQTWTWAIMLAVLGVLMHTGLLVRHAVHATRMAASEATVTICQGNGQAPLTRRLPQPDEPLSPRPAACPDCMAAADAPSALPCVADGLKLPPLPFQTWAPSPQAAPTIRAELPAPGRGPPIRAV